MNGDGWTVFHRIWRRLQPPLRPNIEVVAALTGAIRDHCERALLLGVTPELCDIGADTIAIDSSAGMIAHVWPGDTSKRRAIRGDWLDLPLERQFTAVIGDGSLNVLTAQQYPLLFAQLEKVLLPGSRLAIRVYATPERCETVEELREETLAGRAGGFHPFKWRLAMALAAQRDDMDVPVDLVHRTFQREFPDRALLARATGWSLEDIAEIDFYAGLATVHSFPTRRQTIAALPKSFAYPRFVSSGSYALAERCPVLIADFRP